MEASERKWGPSEMAGQGEAWCRVRQGEGTAHGAAQVFDY